MSVVSQIIYKALDELKTTCKNNPVCAGCPYKSCCGAYMGAMFPQDWKDLDKMTDTVVERAFTGGAYEAHNAG